MVAYLAQARLLLNQFNTCQIRQVSRYENSHADALSRLVSEIDDLVGLHVPIEILTRWSTTEAEVYAVRQDPS